MNTRFYLQFVPDGTLLPAYHALWDFMSELPDPLKKIAKTFYGDFQRLIPDSISERGQLQRKFCKLVSP